MVVLKDGVIAGEDFGGGQYDGGYETSEISLVGNMSVVIQPGGWPVQDRSNTQGVTFDVTLNLPPDFADQRPREVNTTIGTIKVSMKKLRSL